MVDLAFFAVLIAALFLPGLVRRHAGKLGVLVAAAILLGLTVLIVSTPYLPTEDDVSQDLDGFYRLSTDVFRLLFLFVYGGAALFAVIRAYRRSHDGHQR